MKRAEHGGIFFRVLFLIFFLGCIAVLYFARYPLMRFAAESWVVDEPAMPSDALVVLGDDNYAGDRAFHAADLYREGVAHAVVASGRFLRQNVSLADVIEHDLESFGVPAGSIVKLSSRAQNTKEEAAEVAHLIQARDSEFDPTRWWETRQGQKLFFSELVAYVVAWWELRSQVGSASHAASLISNDSNCAATNG